MYTVKNWKTVNGRRQVDRKAECDQLYTNQCTDGNGNVVMHRVLKSSLVGNVWYGAIEEVKDKAVRVFAGICLTHGRSAYDGTIFGYKDMTEDMGPFYCDCPIGILALLSPTENKNANEWREKCLVQAARKKIKKFMKLPEGVEATYRGGWHITSNEYKTSHCFSGVVYRQTDRVDAISRFVEKYGTERQKEEWAETLASAA